MFAIIVIVILLLAPATSRASFNAERTAKEAISLSAESMKTVGKFAGCKHVALKRFVCFGLFGIAPARAEAMKLAGDTCVIAYVLRPAHVWIVPRGGVTRFGASKQDRFRISKRRLEVARAWTPKFASCGSL